MNMKSYDFEAVAYDGAVYCVGCLPEGVDADGDDVSPVFADSEWDHYPTCDACHAEHDYVNLTTDGRKWLQRREWSAKMQDFGRECDSHAIPLPSFTPFGGYTMIYVDKGGDEICGKCANDLDKQLTLQDYGTYDEGPVIQCAECGDDIESSYGDPDENDKPATT